MPASSEASSLGVHRCLRIVTESLSALLLLSSIALTSFGAFMLYWWKRGDETQAHPVPGYIYLVLALGCAASTSNALSYIGACSRSVFLLSISFWTVLLVLLLEAALAGVLFFSPALLDTVVCPPLDAACLEHRQPVQRPLCARRSCSCRRVRGASAYAAGAPLAAAQHKAAVQPRAGHRWRLLGARRAEEVPSGGERLAKREGFA